VKIAGERKREEGREGGKKLLRNEKNIGGNKKIKMERKKSSF
jgi:hypothetical protein